MLLSEARKVRRGRTRSSSSDSVVSPSTNSAEQEMALRMITLQAVSKSLASVNSSCLDIVSVWPVLSPEEMVRGRRQMGEAREMSRNRFVIRR